MQVGSGIAVTVIRPLAWEPLCATGEALKSKKKKKKKKIIDFEFRITFDT